MGEYCSNHVIEAIADYCSQAKDGEVTVQKPGKGNCVANRCTTPTQDIHRLSYTPAETTASGSGDTGSADAAEAPTTEEAPAETPQQEAAAPPA